MLAQVKPPRPHSELVIALHSPNVFLETGLRLGPPEKSRCSDALHCRVVRSLQSGLWTQYCEIRACSRTLRETQAGISLQSRLRGESGIHNMPRTHLAAIDWLTPFNRYHVSYHDFDFDTPHTDAFVMAGREVLNLRPPGPEADTGLAGPVWCSTRLRNNLQVGLQPREY